LMSYSTPGSPAISVLRRMKPLALFRENCRGSISWACSSTVSSSRCSRRRGSVIWHVLGRSAHAGAGVVPLLRRSCQTSWNCDAQRDHRPGFPGGLFRTCSGFELSQHRWNELRHRGVNMYSIAERLERSLGRHGVQDAVNGFVASNAQNGRAENLIALLIDHDFHEALRLAFLDGACDARHGPAANPDLAIACAGLG